jgi:hypothetical protein
LAMGGGRSQAEKSLTTKQIFRELRGKLNEAAKTPGFFDVGQHVVRQVAANWIARWIAWPFLQKGKNASYFQPLLCLISRFSSPTPHLFCCTCRMWSYTARVTRMASKLAIALLRSSSS